MNKLTKKDVRQTALRWQLMNCNTLNFENLQAGSFAYSMAPALRKIYHDDDEYEAALASHYLYYNCNPWAGNLILGAVLALEENQGNQARETIKDLKTSLMGPLSGVGDTIAWVLLPTIFGSIAGYTAKDGNPSMSFLWLAVYVVWFFVRLKIVDFGYQKGTEIIGKLGKQISTITESASILGLVVVGALISSVVKVETPLAFKTGEVVQEIQPLLDGVLPSLIPVALTFISYRLLTKKNFSMTKLILLFIVIAMIAAFFGLLKAV